LADKAGNHHRAKTMGGQSAFAEATADKTGEPTACLKKVDILIIY